MDISKGHLHLYQWLSLVGVMIGVTLVGLSGSLKSPASDDNMDATSEEKKNEAAVFGGILLILFAQVSFIRKSWKDVN